MSNTSTICLTPIATSLILATAMACSGTERADQAPLSLPEELHGLQLVESHSGEEAAQEIGRLHDQGVAPTESHIGYYGPEAMRAVIYVSRFEAADVAAEQLNAMATAIGSGSGGYGHHTQTEIDGLTVHSVFGHGAIHYFYARGTDLTWLAAPPMLARAALAQLLGIRVDQIPDVGTPPVEA